MRVRIGHNRLEASKACVPTWGVDVGAPGGDLEQMEVERMLCQLKGSEKYCETGRGICCRSCREFPVCDKSCLNSPDRCGYAATEAPYRFVPTPRPRNTGR